MIETARYPYPAPLKREGDPFRIERRLVIASKNQLNDWLTATEADDRLAAMEAEELIVHAARDALALTDADATDATVLSVLYDYLRWMESKDSPESSGPISQPCLDCP